MNKPLYYMIRCSQQRQPSKYVELYSSSRQSALLAAAEIYPDCNYSVISPKPMWSYEDSEPANI